MDQRHPPRGRPGRPSLRVLLSGVVLTLAGAGFVVVGLAVLLTREAVTMPELYLVSLLMVGGGFFCWLGRRMWGRGRQD